MRAADAAVRFHHACPQKHSLIMHETAFFRPFLFCAHRAMNISGEIKIFPKGRKGIKWLALCAIAV